MDNIIDKTAQGAQYVAAGTVGALAAAIVVFSGGTAAPVVIPILHNMAPALNF